MSNQPFINVLLVEDNPADIKLIELALKESSSKFQLFNAETLYEGIDKGKNDRIDIALLDLTLPDSSGFKTINTFISNFPEIPVVVLTGMNNEIVGTQAVKAGAQDFLVKDHFDYKILGRVIRYAVQRFETQQKLKETARELAVSQLRYKEAQEMANFGNWEVDIVTNEMKWTDEVYRIFGYKSGSIIPSIKVYLDYVHYEDKELVERFFDKLTKDGKAKKLEHRIVLDGRNIKYVSVQAKVHFDEMTNRTLLVGVMQDITDRKMSEILLLEKNINQKAQSDKKKALEEFNFHIRTPMSTISNLLYLMDHQKIPVTQREIVNGLKTSFDDLSIMINNLLNFSMLTSEKLEVENEEIELSSFIGSIEKISQIKASNAGVKYIFHTGNSLPERVGLDYNKLNHILYNLIENAIRYADKGETVKVTFDSKVLSMQRVAMEIEVSIKSQSLVEEDLDLLFDVERLLNVYNFEEDSDKNPLGMAIVKKLTQLVGGTLDITSDLEQGTTFRLSIPAIRVESIGEKGHNTLEEPLRILFVEDHFLNQIATKKLLTSWSKYATVDIAENGLIGVEKFRAHEYDLVLMDIQMPIMDGFEATSKIRSMSDIPIIALTANASKKESEKCLAAGMNDYLPKPFKPEQLFSKILNLAKVKVS